MVPDIEMWELSAALRVGGALWAPDVVLEQEHQDCVVWQRREVFLVIYLQDNWIKSRMLSKPPTFPYLSPVLFYYQVHLQPVIYLKLFLGWQKNVFYFLEQNMRRAVEAFLSGKLKKLSKANIRLYKTLRP